MQLFQSGSVKLSTYVKVIMDSNKLMPCELRSMKGTYSERLQ